MTREGVWGTYWRDGGAGAGNGHGQVRWMLVIRDAAAIAYAGSSVSMSVVC